MHRYFTPLLIVMIKTVQVHNKAISSKIYLLYRAEEPGLDMVAEE
jgi:hypothetical protein